MARKYEQIFDGDWYRAAWRGNREQCCGCGLVHDVDFRRGPAGTLEARCTVNKRQTAAVRRSREKKADIMKPKSKALTPNPKDIYGARKVSLSKLPAVAVAHGAHAMMDGAQKYGAYNWRDKAVVASIYVDACKRHVDDWFEGQKRAKDSEVHHLGHALACIAIILDAEETGNLIDDRPEGAGVADRVFDEIAAILARRGVAKERATKVAKRKAAKARLARPARKRAR